MIIFTSICANYLHKARTLAASVKAHMPDAQMLVCLLEREMRPEYGCKDFDRVVLAKDAWEGDFDRFIFKHAIVEASTAVKGQFFRYLYRTYPGETQFVYLDPDTYVYGDFVELRALLAREAIVLCPHLLKPGNIEMELSSTAHGVYNLGFLAVNASEEARRFIDWWAARLALYCYDDILKGIFTDQKWVELAPSFFDVHIFKHPGYDFATWSLLGCNMTLENGKATVEGYPLRFIHYSGFGALIQRCMAEWLPPGDHPFKALYADYAKHHNANNQDRISGTPWSYGCYGSGQQVGDKARIRYRSTPSLWAGDPNPFTLSDAHYRLRFYRVVRHKLSDAKGRFSGAVARDGWGKTLKRIIGR